MDNLTRHRGPCRPGGGTWRKRPIGRKNKKKFANPWLIESVGSEKTERYQLHVSDIDG